MSFFRGAMIKKNNGTRHIGQNANAFAQKLPLQPLSYHISKLMSYDNLLHIKVTISTDRNVISNHSCKVMPNCAENA